MKIIGSNTWGHNENRRKMPKSVTEWEGTLKKADGESRKETDCLYSRTLITINQKTLKIGKSGETWSMKTSRQSLVNF